MFSPLAIEGNLVDSWLGVGEKLIVVIPVLFLLFRKGRDYLMLHIVKQLDSIKRQVEPDSGGSLNDFTKSMKESSDRNTSILERFEQGLSEVKREVQSITSDIKGLKSKQTEIQQKQDAVQNHLDQRLLAQDLKMDAIQTHLDRLSMHAANNDLNRSRLLKEAAAREGIPEEELERQLREDHHIDVPNGE